MLKHEMPRLLRELLVVCGTILVVILALLAEWLRNDSAYPDRRHRQHYESTLATKQMEERKRKQLEEQHRAEEARYKKHLLYVVARFNKKDSTSRRFIVLNTSRADIDSGRAIVFAHSWGGKAASAWVLDTTEIALRPIPSGRRDTLVVPQHGRGVMRYAIDSVALVGIVFR